MEASVIARALKDDVKVHENILRELRIQNLLTTLNMMEGIVKISKRSSHTSMIMRFRGSS